VVDYYRPNAQIPAGHTPIVVGGGDRLEVPLVLKLEPSEALALADARWEVSVEHDVRLATLVALLKAAHLTLFELVGYRYALSAGGRFLGWDALGRFYLDHRGRSRQEALDAAMGHFSEFVNLVRPMLEAPDWLAGTVNDGHVYLCTGSPVAWAILVFIKAGVQLHAVLVPVLEDAEAAGRLVRFLREEGPVRFEARLGKFDGSCWEVSKTPRIIEWPAARLSDGREGLAV
jgi:hypothetical protein